MAFKMNKNKSGSLYQKSVYRNSTSFKRVDTDLDEIAPVIKKGTKEGESYVKNTPGTKFEFGGEYYDTREDFEKAIAADKGMSLAEYRASKKSKTTRKTGVGK
jgi:hypothetical protein